MKSLIFFALVAIAIAQDTAYFCEVAIENFCSGGNQPCPDTPSYSSGSILARRASQSIDFTNYNIISFQNFNGASDTEGRVAVAGDATLTTGYSIGDKIWTEGPGATDSQVPYSLVVGGDLVWPSGALYPMASNNFYAAGEEFMFVGGSVTAPSYLGSSSKSDSVLSGSIRSEFAAAQTYYTNMQNAFNAVPSNVAYTVSSNGDLNITCSAGATGYSLSISESDFNNIRTYYFVNCDDEIQIVFNVQGTGSVTFSGNNIALPRRAETILFNILGSGRSITVAGASVRGNILAPNNNLNTINGGYIQGFQVYGNVANSRQINRVNCQPPASPIHPPAPSDLCPGFEADCAGLDITLPSPAPQTTFSFRDCNVISFTDFRANTGDVEGRVCVARDFSVGMGYSVGYELSTNNDLPDRSTPVALIAGRDCSWPSGALYPDGSNAPHPGAKEDAFCGGSFTGSDDLRNRVTYSCATPGCLDTTFTAAKGCYSGYSAQLAAKTDNVATRVQWSALFLTCANPTATEYVFSVTPETMSQYSYYVMENCNFQAYWVMNVRGSGDVTFTGDWMAVTSGAAVINVIGSRTINVSGIKLLAHLLAPAATLNQTGGVIVGKVVANDIAFSLQINRENTCPDIVTVLVPIVPLPPNTPNTPTIPASSSSSGDASSSSSSGAASSSSSGSASSSSTTGDVVVPPTAPGCINVYARSMFRNGDQVVFNDVDATVVSTQVDNVNEVCFDPPSAVGTSVMAKQSGHILLRSDSGRKVISNPTKSAASVVGVTVGFFAIIALFL